MVLVFVVAAGPLFLPLLFLPLEFLPLFLLLLVPVLLVIVEFGTPEFAIEGEEGLAELVVFKFFAAVEESGFIVALVIAGTTGEAPTIAVAGGAAFVIAPVVVPLFPLAAVQQLCIDFTVLVLVASKSSRSSLISDINWFVFTTNRCSASVRSCRKFTSPFSESNGLLKELALFTPC